MRLPDYVAEVAQFLQVVELYPGTNRAFRQGWQNKHMTPEQARAAWEDWPSMNVGVVAHPRWWVLDLDGPDTVAWYRSFPADGAMDTLTIRTPGRGGGLHLWWQMFPVPEGMFLRSSLPGCPHAEIKHGPGRQTAWPPSRRQEGYYTFEPGTPRVPAPTPQWLQTLCVRDKPASEPVVDLGSLARDDTSWGSSAYEALVGRVESVTERVRRERAERNNLTFWAACTLFDVGAWPEHFDVLVDAARETGLSDNEIQRTIESARRNRS